MATKGDPIRTGSFLGRALGYYHLAGELKHLWLGHQYAFDIDDVGSLDAPICIPSGATVCGVTGPGPYTGYVSRPE